MEDTFLNLCDRMSSQEGADDMTAFVEENVRNNTPSFITVLRNIIGNPDVKRYPVMMALTLLIHYFPEDLPDFTTEEQTLFDLLPPDTITEIINTSYDIMMRGEGEISHIAASLLGKIVAIYVHLQPETPIVEQVVDSLAATEEDEKVVSICQALTIILANAAPEKELLEKLLNVMFPKIGINTYCSIISVLNCIVQYLGDIFENEQNLAAVTKSLLDATAREEYQDTLFNCWYFFGKYHPCILAIFSEVLVGMIVDSLNTNEEKDAQMAACHLLRRIARLEILDSESELKSIKDHSSDIIQALRKVYYSDVPKEADSPGIWEPRSAVINALEAVMMTDPGLIFEENWDSIADLLISQNYQDRDFALVFVECLLQSPGASVLILKVAPQISKLFRDQTERIRCRLLRVFGLGYRDIESTPESLKIAQLLLKLQPALDQSPKIAASAAFMFSSLATLDGFAATESILTELFNRITDKSLYLFDEIIWVVDKCPKGEVVLKFFPYVVDGLRKSLAQTNLNSMLDLIGETITAYVLRFGKDLEMFVGETLNILFGGCNEHDCLFIPFASMASLFMDQFGQLVYGLMPKILSSLENFELPDAQKNACEALGILIKAGLEVTQEIMDTLLQLLHSTETNVGFRCSILRCFESFPIEIFKEVEELKGIVSELTAAVTLLIGSSNEEGARDLAGTLCALLVKNRKLPKESIWEESVEMSVSLLSKIADLEVVDHVVVWEALKLVESLISSNLNDLLILIGEKPRVGEIIAQESARFEDCLQLRSAVLTSMGYVEDDVEM